MVDQLDADDRGGDRATRTRKWFFNVFVFGHSDVAIAARRSRCTSRDTARQGRDAPTPRPHVRARYSICFGNRHSDRHAPREDPGAPFAFKDSMIH